MCPITHCISQNRALTDRRGHLSSCPAPSSRLADRNNLSMTKQAFCDQNYVTDLMKPVWQSHLRASSVDVAATC